MRQSEIILVARIAAIEVVLQKHLGISDEQMDAYYKTAFQEVMATAKKYYGERDGQKEKGTSERDN